MEFNYQGKTVAFYTLGCKLNFSETSTMAQKFEDIGFQRTDFKEQADVYVLNSCSVTAESDKKSRNYIRSAIRRNPKALVLVTGCYAQLKANDLAQIEGVDYVLGSAEKLNVTSYLNNLVKTDETVISLTPFKEINDFHKAYSYGDRTRSFLKVQDGCNYFCTYCTIPMARGKSRNDTIDNTVEEAKLISQKGIKEVILTGVNIGDFGRSSNETFFDLVKALDEVEGIERYRISSIEPNLLTDEIIDFVANSKRFAPHFHLPLQSGSNEVLKLMKRKYNRELFAERVTHIKKVIPHAFIGVDVIAGTNGETEAYFSDTYNFLRDLDISQLHPFPYSERPNTAALKIDGVVPKTIRKERVQRLIELSNRKLRLFYEQSVGDMHSVLFEQSNVNNKILGWTDNYIRVEVPWDKNLVNKVFDVKLGNWGNENRLIGEIFT